MRIVTREQLSNMTATERLALASEHLREMETTQRRVVVSLERIAAALARLAESFGPWPGLENGGRAMKYIIDIDDKTGAATIQIGDQKPVPARILSLSMRREPVVNEQKTMRDPGMFRHHDEGPIGQFTVSAELHYATPVEP